MPDLPPCPSTFTVQPRGRAPYLFGCQAGLNHAGNHRHLAASGVARVWRDTPDGRGELLAKVRTTPRRERERIA